MPLLLDVESRDDPVTLKDVTKAHDAGLRAQRWTRTERALP